MPLHLTYYTQLTILWVWLTILRLQWIDQWHFLWVSFSSSNIFGPILTYVKKKIKKIAWAFLLQLLSMLMLAQNTAEPKYIHTELMAWMQTRALQQLNAANTLAWFVSNIILPCHRDECLDYLSICFGCRRNNRIWFRSTKPITSLIL